MEYVLCLTILFDPLQDELSVTFGSVGRHTPQSKEDTKDESDEFNLKVNAWEEEISELLGVMTEIKINKGGKGEVILPFTSLERLQRLIHMLKYHMGEKEAT